MSTVPKTLDELLNEVDYKLLNSTSYVPSAFSLKYMNFNKLARVGLGEAFNKTPTFHLRMIDKVVENKDPIQQILNLCYRGAGKTVLFVEDLIPFLAAEGGLPGMPLNGLIYVGDSMDNGVKNTRENIRHRYENSPFLQEVLPYCKITEDEMVFKNSEGKKFKVLMYGAKSGIRGTKIYGQRPKLALLDDLIGDKDGESPASLNTIRNIIYKGIKYALNPEQHKIILNGTPFNKDDPIVSAAESGAWDVNVWPVCERFPCSEEEFVGSWPDRFSYKNIKHMYENSILQNTVDAFNQELMLRLSSEEERMVQDSEIRWYSRPDLLKYKDSYNFYITTDFATSTRNKADYTVLSVWAYNSNGDWFWVDGFIGRVTMDVTIDKLFKLVEEYQPKSVGIEVTGQQGGFIPWLQKEMQSRGVWFNLASSGKGGVGIRPTTSKIERFSLVVPWFKAGKMFFPQEMKTSEIMTIFMSQISLVTINGIKGKDDAIDTISMLAFMQVWKPASNVKIVEDTAVNIWYTEPTVPEISALNSYIV